MILGTSLVVQQLRHLAPNVGVLGLSPDQGTRPHMPKLKDLSHGNEDLECHNQESAQPNK